MFVYNSFNKDLSGEFYINKDGVFFPFKLDKKNSNELVIFFPGAYNKSLEKPKFQRSSYSESLDKTCLYLFDPTLFIHEDLTLGWFLGKNELDYTVLLSEIVREIVDNLGIEFDNILFFATSAGGITALKLSMSFPAAKVYLGNIQTNILKYYKSPVNLLLSCCFDDSYNIEDNRFNVLNDVSSKNKIFYSQNLLDEFHYINHYLPFFNINNFNNIEYNLYEHPTKHSPISKEFEILVIDSIFKKNSLRELYLSLNLVSG